MAKLRKNSRNHVEKPPSGINEPGYIDEDNIYAKKNAEEAEKIPVEYLGYVQKQRAANVIRTLIAWIIFALVAFFGPGISGRERCPQCGRERTYFSLAWGRWEFRGVAPVDTEWTKWYEAQYPLPHYHHWILFGRYRPALFGYLTLPLDLGTDWVWPENLMQRMEELKSEFRPGKVLEIPTALLRVNNAEEWEAIIMPLTMGTPQEAYEWWRAHYPILRDNWLSRPFGTPMPEEFIDASKQYVESKTPHEDTIPI